jgi:hypothetical protein
MVLPVDASLFYFGTAARRARGARGRALPIRRSAALCGSHNDVSGSLVDAGED